ncbi:MAG TPA: shikimate dehydrogenase [Spirochaetaceae bacterium]|nr:shikimate dehydrogenase [Spirochaetaceae bacterium]
MGLTRLQAQALLKVREMEYGLIGERLSHSFSKTIHAMIGNYKYDLIELNENELEKFMAKRDFKGINVTIPFKTSVVRYLDWISPEAKETGAVNTIVCKSGRLFGYNTDFLGLKALISRQPISLDGKKALVLGTGGTSRTAKAVLKSIGVKTIYQASRTPNEDAICYEAAEKLDVDYVINTTPVGMFPNSNSMPIRIDNYRNLIGITDVIYNPLYTDFIQSGLQKGIPASGGLYMLAAQAVHAANHFGTSAGSEREICDIYHRILSQKLNIVLIGMPSCGKTTIGRHVCKGMVREFADTDAIIARRLAERGFDMTIADFITRFGEKRFRKEESEVVREISEKNGLVVSTGGGVPLSADNMRMLKHNGIVFWIDRPLSLLKATSSRPLTSTRESLERKYAERAGLYSKYADVRVPNEGSVTDAVAKIVRGFNEKVSCC